MHLKTTDEHRWKDLLQRFDTLVVEFKIQHSEIVTRILEILSEALFICVYLRESVVELNCSG